MSEMVKYGNDNFEEQIHEDGTTLVSNVPISPVMKKEAAEVIKNSKDCKQEIVNKKDRVESEEE